MKRIVAWVLAALLLVALGAAALAEEEPWIMYCQEDDVPVYAEKDTESKVVTKLEKGEEVQVEKASKSGKWYAVYYEKKGKQKVGWVEAKYLDENPPCKHKWGEWQVYTEPTCTETGLRIRTCSRCGASEAVDIEKLPHTFGKWKVKKEATCTREGLQSHVCKVCGAEEEKKIEKLPHDFDDWTVEVEATCAEEGERVRECQECGYVQTQAIEKLPHTFGAWKIVIEATDHSSGTRRRTCTVCGASERESYDPEGTLRRGDRGDAVREIQQLLADQGYLKGSGVDGIFGSGVERAVIQFQTDQGLEPDGVAWPQTIKRLHHEFGPWETAKKLTRTDDGERVRTCEECGYQERQTVEAGKTWERRARGEDVRQIQTMLNDLGYNAGTADGVYGQKLDNAYDAFALDHDVDDFTPGVVLPTHVDALANAWIGEQSATGDWMGAGSASEPVNLVLTVKLADASLAGSDMLTFEWTLRNTGTERCRFNLLLLNYGKKPDFTRDNLVMAVDNSDLRPNGANTLSGTFSVCSDWGKGRLDFCAVATSAKTGRRWLSNTRNYKP